MSLGGLRVDTFNFLSVLFSVIMGLALTEVLQGFRRLILARRRVVLYWPALLWGGLMILIVAQAWWGMFGMRVFQSWNFAMYGIVVVQITLMYLASGVAMPELPEHGPVDMRAAYFANNRWFFSLLAATIASTFLKDFITVGRIGLSWNVGFLLLCFSMSVIAAATRSAWYHCLLAPFVIVAMAVYTTFLSFWL